MKIPSSEREAVLFLKSNIDALRENKDLMDTFFERSFNDDSWKEIAFVLVNNKYVPIKYSKLNVNEFIKAQIELEFNPGTEGILEYCDYSLTDTTDNLISKLIEKYSTNKYDAGFSKRVLNTTLYSDKIKLTATIKKLGDKSNNTLLYYEDLKNQNIELFYIILLKLDSEVQKKISLLLNGSDLNKLNNSKFDKIIVDVFKILKNSECPNLYGGNFSKIISNKDWPGVDKLTGEEYYYLVENSSMYSTIEYNKHLENFEFLRNRTFKNVPYESIYFFSAFLSGTVSINADQALEILSGQKKNIYGRSEHYLNRRTVHAERSVAAGIVRNVFNNLSDSEASKLVSENQQVFLSFVDKGFLTPKTLADSIPESHSLTIKEVYKIVSGPYKKQMFTTFGDKVSDSTIASKESVSDKHAKVVNALQMKLYPNFISAIEDYSDNDFSGNLEEFFGRQHLTTYTKKSEGIRLSSNFISSSTNEEILIRLIKTFSFDTWSSKDISSIMSTKGLLELLETCAIDSSRALRWAKDKKEFIMALKIDDLSSLNEESVKKSKQIKLIAKRIADLILSKKGAVKDSDKLDLNSDLKKEVCSLLDKDTAKKHISLSFTSYQDEETEIKFKEGVKFDLEDVKSELPDISSYNVLRILNVIEKLESTESKSFLIEIAEAILDKKATRFKEIFPGISTRNDDLRKAAVQILDRTGKKKVDMNQLIKEKSHNLGVIEGVVGKDYLKKLLGDEVEPTYINADFQEDIETLDEIKKKHKVFIHSIRIGNADNIGELKKIKEIIKSGHTIKKVVIGDGHHGAHEKNCFIEIMAVCKANDIDCDFEGTIINLASMNNRPDLLDGISNGEIIAQIDDHESLSSAIELAFPINDSKEIARRVIQEIVNLYGRKLMITAALDKGFSFNNIEVILDKSELDILQENLKSKKLKANSIKDIGINLIVSEEVELKRVINTIFDEQKNLKDFESVSLSFLDVSDRINLIKSISIKNPKYKKLLSTNITDRDFVLLSPKEIDKALPTIANLKDIIGVGIPGDLTSEEKECLNNIIIYKHSMLKIAHSNYTKYLSALGLKSVDFKDFFDRRGSSLSITKMADFFFENNNIVFNNNSDTLFKTMLKNINREEAISLIKDSEEKFGTSFLVDSFHAIGEVRNSLNKIFSQIDNADLSANIVFEAMAGNGSANNTLESMLNETTVGEILRELSNLIKVKTVEISIARKNAKNTGSFGLSVKVHDLLGELVSGCNSIWSKGIEHKKISMKSGFSDLNAEVTKEDYQVTGPKGVKYEFYFPDNLKEVREIGTKLKWCTSYNDTYFNAMISGKAVLFNLKLKGEIKAQGYFQNNGRSITLSQIKYSNNDDAIKDFNSNEISVKLEELIKRHKKLNERYFE